MPIRSVNGSERGPVDEINEHFMAADMRLFSVDYHLRCCVLSVESWNWTEGPQEAQGEIVALSLKTHENTFSVVVDAAVRYSDPML